MKTEKYCGQRSTYTGKEGFSLIEVIIAVALLALLAMPVLAYFTNAAVTTSRGRDTQQASMAAQTVMEEIHSFDTLEQLEDYMLAQSTADPVWNMDQAESITGEDGKSTVTTLKKNDIEVDGTKFNTKVTLEYDYPVPSATDSPYTNPNLQKMPELKEVYSGENAVVEEGDQLDRAVSHYLMKYTTMTQTDIAKKLTRELRLEIIEKDSIYTVTGLYHYIYDGNESDSYDVVITRTKVKDLANVYFFYNRTQYVEGGSTVVVNVQEKVNVSASTTSTDTEAQSAFQKNMENMHIYFVCQKAENESTIDVGHSLNFSIDTTAAKAVYHTNIASSNVVGILSGNRKDLVTSSIKRRIAKVTVDVYDSADTAMTDSLVHLESSKGE